jgi:hypothetical protein
MSLIQDLRQIVTMVLPADPCLRMISGDTLDHHVTDARTHALADDKDAFLLSLMRLLALPGNGHTRLIPNDAISVLPLRFATIGTAVRLINASPDHSDAMGGELIAINGSPTSQIEGAARQLLAGTRQRQRVIGPILFAWPGALRHLGISSGDEPVEYRIGHGTGQIRTLRLDPATGVPGSLFYPRNEHGKADPSWSPTSFLRVRDFGPAGLLLVLPSFYDPGETALSEAITTAADLVRSRPGLPLLIDLRGNTGGNFLRTLPLIDAISRGAQDRRVGLLVDKFTFSAAIVFVAILKDRLKDRLILIGEEMGDGLTFFAEGGTIALPFSGAAVRYSTALHDWAGGRIDETTPPEIAERIVPVGTLDLDRVCVVSADDAETQDRFCGEVLDSLNR